MSRSHPPPTDAVIKELYGTASRCALPDCQQPLYREVAGGSRVLNSRVAHIAARSEEGPRWRDDQSEAENRSFENLLLLCIPHASEVDDPKHAHRFSETTLRTWKQTQLTTGKGYRLSDAEAKTVAELSFRSVINIRGQTLHFGGQGGQAPGAAGGGGAAIGHGAVGGPGGAVGAPNRFFLHGSKAAAPGAGGGGGASIHLSRVAWQDRPPEEQAPHFHDLSSEPTSDIRVTSLFLADTVRTPGGLLYVFGGNPEFFAFASLPQAHSVVVVCAVHLTGLPESLAVKLVATVYNPAGVAVVSQEFLVAAGEPGGVSLRHQAFDMRFSATEVGEWRVAVVENENCLAWTPFEVRFRQ